MKYAIVTGVSKGLGNSLAKYLLELNIHVCGIARTNDDKLIEIAKENNVSYHFFKTDLCSVSETERAMTEINQIVFAEDISQLYLINNAAIVHPIKKATEVRSAELVNHYQINVISPMMIMNECLRKCNDNSIPFIGVNITSGAAKNAFYGWSAYCSSKASLDMYTKAVAIEQEELKTDSKIIAFSPGVMDTDMQTEIRASDYNEFIDVDTFKHYKKQNILSDTEAVASVLVDIITDEVNVQNGKIYDVKNYF